MMDFYDLIDTYAELHNMEGTDVLDLWYRGTINPNDLLKADLENEGIYGYGEHLINIIKILEARSLKDFRKKAWEE